VDFVEVGDADLVARDRLQDLIAGHGMLGFLQRDDGLEDPGVERAVVRRLVGRGGWRIGGGRGRF
jgi:hypothetical protein